ncbi:bifunctional [glutamate--ammonia ligase]-adenylyl-L-tyrosine phosphorylase/[glutamate--ammonia-ligase] adenylyltransferase [Comamonas denitrificans]|uniref:Bifunctional glutamine synthetase adenylyltransferase/adenylyl-removing enzyme n=1 Tax=Comamonas denitrificans TaxID=117506 RepID=A0A939KCW9_9BURK|nr:bifunctional [glutamate--ammonia ligase]-adenylyl-L-tyrosine phosphorylase/[glutamate--ammonia-ligase] adenylyltransferase [Comamonas denitrificans]MBO1248719.1 bifunctional [glutamate--ammonia ligase]-adenylyl-L-tyrosine phosphorylase/[glutamate--ammonia-ligase] adenylyltransferase [Comamonas denitrificans]
MSSEIASPPSPAGGPSPAWASTSRFWQRVQRRYADAAALLPPGQPTASTMSQALAQLLAQGQELGTALRILRQLVVARVLERDCAGQASLAEVTASMTALAELALDAACTQAQTVLSQRHGQPQGPHGQVVPLWIVGMGKLGARELNVSSDIDLIYVYGHEGETTGRDALGKGSLSNHEYFTRVVRMIFQLIGEVTEHGFVFRVDLALRPHGNSGPTVICLPALQTYLQTHGREWERFAWLKSRVVAPRACIASAQVKTLRHVVLPFVFRKYLDYSVFDALRDLHRQIREHASRRSNGQPGRSNDVKLSPGGIREIEFTVQLLQVVRGGQFPELRCRPTLQALERLAKAELMPPATAQQLAQAYRFLRQVEHRIQYLDDLQTHVLPTEDGDLDWIARTMGCATTADFFDQLHHWRELVAQEFDALLGGPATGCAGGLCQPPKRPGGPQNPPEVQALLAVTPAPLAERLKAWCDTHKVPSLRPSTQTRLLQLLELTAQWLQAQKTNLAAVLAFLQWLEPLLRRESYLALLIERPLVHERLLHMLGTAAWPVQYLRQHPGVIDELANESLVHERFNPQVFLQELQARRAALQRTGEDDDENLLNLLRRAHHAEVFRTLVRDVEGAITVEQVADDLSALADAILHITSQWCWQRLKQRHCEQPHFAILGYGKLGGKELGYGSDLDIVFVFDDDDEQAPQIYAAFVRKLITWLTVKTSEGDLFEIDTQLRPNGNSGLLVSSFAAFSAYQQQRGSNTAWTWEHQAITRARCIVGNGDLPARFEAVRQAVLTAPRDIDALRQEIVHMRERLRQAHPVPAERFDLKYSPGGMLDGEFAVQFLVLAHAAAHPALVANAGNIALLHYADAAGLVPPGTGQAAADAYRQLRRLQHISRLNASNGVLDAISIAPHRDAILALWAAVFPPCVL